MTDRGERKRVLIVGAGFRAANNFLPAFALRPDAFEVVGILAPSRTRSGPLGDRWDLPVFQSLQQVKPYAVDIVAVTVPTSQNASVLESLLKWNASVDLAIDTPIAWTYREYRRCLPLLRQFRTVVVAEDFMNLPQFELTRAAVRDGLLGRLRSVTLFNTGFAYHGLSLIRSFANLARVTRSRRTLLGSYSSVLGYSLFGGMRGYIVGPYRQLVTGGIVVEGERGVITQAAEDIHFAKLGKRKLYHLSTVPMAGTPSEFVIHNSSYALSMPEIGEMSRMPFDDQSQLNVLKNIGLTRIFHSLIVPDELNRSYGFENALYDSFTSRLAARGMFPLDPLVFVNKDHMLIPGLASRRGTKDVLRALQSRLSISNFP